MDLDKGTNITIDSKVDLTLSAIYNQSGTCIIASYNAIDQNLAVLDIQTLKVIKRVKFTLAENVNHDLFKVYTMSGYCKGNLMMYAVAFHPDDMTMGYQVYCHLNLDLEQNTLDFNLLKT